MKSRFTEEQFAVALRKLGHRVTRTTVSNILKENGLDPAPERSKHTTWTGFLRVHWDSIAALDFFIIESWIAKGLTRFHVLFVIDLSTRRVEIARISRPRT